MAFNRFVRDIKEEALFRAGEPQDGTSNFDSTTDSDPPVIKYINRIVHDLVGAGGGVAVGQNLAQSAGVYARLVQPRITDWFWARRRGVLTTTPRQVVSATTLTNGSRAVTLTGTFVENPLGSRLVIDGFDTIPQIVNVTGLTTTSATCVLDSIWPEDTTTTGGLVARLEYDLPEDFLRFANPPSFHSGTRQPISVGSLETRDMDFPLSGISQGVPTRAFMVSDRRIALDTYDDTGYRMEYEYIAIPAYLTTDDEPPLPQHYRVVLAVGAAMLMMFDKDDSRAANLASEYRELVSAMEQEHASKLAKGSVTFGQYRTRQNNRATRARQPFGELYIV